MEENPVKFVTRAEWGAQYPPAFTPIPGPVYGVTLHWEGPHMGAFPHAVCARKVRTIERFHKITRGWAGIAYNLLVCPHGHVFEGRGAGVRSAANGTSSIGGNDHWYAVCYLGGQGDGFTDDGKQGFVDAIGWLRDHGAGPRVNGHRDHHPTDCPGEQIYTWLNRAGFTARTATEEDNMEWTDWSEKSRDQAKREIVRELLDHKITGDGLTFVQAVRRAAKAAKVLEALNDLPDRIEVNLPTTSTLTRADVRKAVAGAVREVLGSLDDKEQQ